MVAKTRVLIVGLEPSLIDFSDPAYGRSGLDAAEVRAGLEADKAHLDALGYDAELCLTDFGETAEMVLGDRLATKSFDCVLIGAGVRLIAENTFLFEQLVNVVHAEAPRAKLCFNTKPRDTAAAVQRWFPATAPA
jgi:hypothetical protein